MKLEQIVIRKISNSDVENLQEIGKNTFFDTFSADNSKENMETYLNTKFSLQQLTEELNNENSEFYFAELEKQTIGYLKVNTGNSQTEIQDDSSLEIERIYVLKKFHGKHVGRLLLKKALEIANSRRFESIWLSVWEKNLKAIQFYKRNGFIEFDKKTFKLGIDLQRDIMMKLKLKK
ncbi:GNAT family N-acetyltransferase [Reichenbachiella sp.]|uniref:GNAT family N-acetyltransferase n=1 Tax=Reichenbachiella sp. TaxID=2184521 RepID=UPI003BB124B2